VPPLGVAHRGFSSFNERQRGSPTARPSLCKQGVTGKRQRCSELLADLGKRPLPPEKQLAHGVTGVPPGFAGLVRDLDGDHDPSASVEVVAFSAEVIETSSPFSYLQ
jgi:hypothetical protein